VEGYIDSRGGGMYVKKGSIQEISVLSSLFYYEPKTVLKNKLYYKKKLAKEKDTTPSKCSVATKPGFSGRRCPIKPTFTELQKEYQSIKYGKSD
jgi:hypothetical protein